MARRLNVARFASRWHLIIRLEQLGLGPDQIAKITGLSTPKITWSQQRPEYQEIREAKLQRRISAYDREFAKQTDEMCDRLKELVPLCFQAYEDGLKSNDLAIRLRAADSVLDRDGIFAKQANLAIQHIIPQEELTRARNLAKQLKAKSVQTIEATTVNATDDTITAEFTGTLPANSPEDACKVDVQSNPTE